ncbi:MAG: CCA tRNA nucleotidyltransferase [Enterococcus faecalis]|nr:CCA tRNA nucleotidyltransferase [Enterococcus faecalis]
MKLTTIPNEFKEAAPVIREINAQGFEAYFVGGSVRDALLNKPIHDVDIATSAYPEEIKQIFKRTVDVGIEHGTVLVLMEDQQYEVTTFRTESTYQDFRRPDEVTFVRSLKEDLKRRDFTINALALDSTGEIIDLFDGIEDLTNQTIRAVGNPHERFHEDALRMMRGLRFASQLDFKIEEKTLAAIAEFHPLLEKISVERITIEFVKMLLGVNRQGGLAPFIETEAEAWTLLIQSLNLPEAEIRSFLKAWKLSNQLIQNVSQLVRGLRFRLSNDWQPMMLYELGEESAVLVERLLYYYQQESQVQVTKELVKALPIHQRHELTITGKDLLAVLEETPGKWLGELIAEIEQHVVEGSLENKQEVLLSFAKKQRSKGEKA